MTTTPRKPKEKREVAELEPAEAKLGPKMLGLTLKQRNFVIALFAVRQGRGAAVRAARAAGFGNPGSSPASMATISSRLMHTDAIIEGMREYGEQFLRGAAPAALLALQKLILTPSHKGHERAVTGLVQRLYPTETQYTVKVEHTASSSMKATAEVFARIMDLSARANVPPMIDVTPEKAPP
jgi:hypothetical protein